MRETVAAIAPSCVMRCAVYTTKLWCFGFSTKEEGYWLAKKNTRANLCLSFYTLIVQNITNHAVSVHYDVSGFRRRRFVKKSHAQRCLSFFTSLLYKI